MWLYTTGNSDDLHKVRIIVILLCFIWFSYRLLLTGHTFYIEIHSHLSGKA